jgi:SAM-dependent methyltransferase
MIVRQLVDLSSRCAAIAKRWRVVQANDPVVKVNLGCGLAVAPGWYNVDASINALLAGSPVAVLNAMYRLSGARNWYSRDQYVGILRQHRFIHHNLAFGIPFRNESIDFLYSSHWLEHIYYEQAQFIMREVRRVLKPSGTVRICVPDLEVAVRCYREGQKSRMLDYFFPKAKSGELGCHHWMYDFDGLEALMATAGLTDIVRCGFRQGYTPDIEILDNRDDETLYVEAKAPSCQP